MAITYSSPIITITGGISTGTATGGSSTTLIDSSKSWTDIYVTRIVFIHTGTGAGQVRHIASTSGTTLTVTEAWTTNPSTDSQYAISYDVADIKSANDSGGWGVVAQQGNQYRFSAAIVVGDGTTGTAFADRNKHIELTVGQQAIKANPNGNVWSTCVVRNKAALRFGVVTGIADKKSAEGCAIIDAFNGYVTEIVGGQHGSRSEIYSSHICSLDFWNYGSQTTYQDNGASAGYSAFICWNTILVYVDPSQLSGLYEIADFFNVAIMNGGIAIRVKGTTDKISVYGASWTYAGSDLARAMSYRGIYGRGAPDLFRAQSISVHSYLIDIDVDTKTIRWDGTSTGWIFMQWSHNFNVVGGASNVRFAMFNNAATQVFNDVTDGAGVLSEKIVSEGYFKQSTGSTIQSYTPHTLKIRKYGKIYQSLTRSVVNKVVEGVTLANNNFVVANEATALAYSGISVTWGSSLITVSGTRTIQELYDYLEAKSAESGNMQYAEPLTTINGTTFTLASGWSITVTGSLKDSAKTINGTISVSGSGIYEGANGVKWAAGGSTYYASHFFHNVKDASDSSNIQNAVIAYVDANGVDRTYNTSLANGGIKTDASGNVEGYAVYKIDAAEEQSMKLLVGEYNYTWAVIPKTVAGLAIGSSGSREVVRLTSDTNVSLSKATADAVSGVTVNHTTFVCNMASNNLSNTFHNLKSRQADTADIEAGKAGYMSFYDVQTYSDTGLILRFDSSVYWGAYKWTFSNSGGGGTLKERDDVGAATTQVSIDVTNLHYGSVTGTDIAFDSATKTISSTTTDLTNFYDNQSIIITGSTSNDGTYTVNGSPIATSLVVDEALVNESAGASVTIDGSRGTRIQILNTSGRDEADWAASTAYTTGDGVRELFKSVTSITRSGNTATVTQTAHGYSTGWHIRIQGANQAEYNGLKDITVTGADTYTFSVGSNPTSPATGTITARNEEYWYECVGSGTSGGSEPAWDNTVDNETTDNTATWKTRVIEILNTEATTTSAGVAYEHKGTNRNIRVRLMFAAGVKCKKWNTFTGTITDNGFSQAAAQETNDVYEDNNIDGSLVTECSVIEDQIKIYIDDPDNTTTAQRIYNWFQYHLQTAEGIYDQDNFITSADQTHYTLTGTQKIVNLDTSNPLEITGANIVPASGSATAIYDVSNGASIVLNFNRVEAFTYSTGSGLSAAQNTKLMSLNTGAETTDLVWDEAQSGHTTAGTFGKYLDTEVSGVGGGTPPTAAAIADAVWDEASADHVAAGSTGEKVKKAGDALSIGKFIALK